MLTSNDDDGMQNCRFVFSSLAKKVFREIHSALVPESVYVSCVLSEPWPVGGVLCVMWLNWR